MPDLASLVISVDSRDLKKGEKAQDSFARKSADTEKRVTGSTQRIGAGFTRLVPVIGAVTAALAAREFIRTADEMVGLEARVKLLTRSMQEFETVQKGIIELSLNTNTGIAESTNLYIKNGKALQDLGKNAKQSLGFIETVNKAVQIGGPSAAEAANGIRQFSQSLASGRFQGDELRSVLENVPSLAFEIAEGLGVTVGQLRELGSEGELTTAKIVEALEKQAPEIARKYAGIPITASKAFVNLQTQIKITTGLLNSATGASSGVASGIDIAGSAVKVIGENIKLITQLATIAGAAYLGRLIGPIVEGKALAGAAEVSYTAKVLAGNVVTLNSAMADKLKAASANSAALAETAKASASLKAASAEVAKKTAVLASIKADIALDNVSLKSAKTEAARSLIIGRMTERRAQYVRITQVLTAAELANTAATSAQSAAAAKSVVTTNAAAAAAAKATLAARTLAAAATVAGRAMALMGGPVGIALLAATALFTLSGRGKEAAGSMQGLRDQVSGLVGDLAKLEQSRAAETINKLSQAISQKLARYAEIERAVNSTIRLPFLSGADKNKEKLESVGAEIRELLGLQAEAEASLNSMIAKQGEAASKTGDSLLEVSVASFDTLMAEIKAYGQGADAVAAFTRQQEINAAVQRQGKDLTESQRAELRGLITTLYDSKKAYEANQAASEKATEEKRRQKEIAAENAAEIQTLISTMAAENTAIANGATLEDIRTRARLVAKGATDEQIAQIMALIKARKDADNAADIQKQITTLQMENAELAKGATLETIRTRAKLAAKGATAEQIKEILALTAAQEELVRVQGLDSLEERLNALSFGDGLGDGFDDMSRAIVDVIGSLEELTEAQQVFDDLREEFKDTPTELAKIEEKAAEQQIGLYGDLAASAKGYFEEGTDGYKALQTAEEVFRAFEIAIAAKNLAIKLGILSTETAATVASNAAKTVSGFIATIANAATSVPFPLNIAAIGATAALLNSFGIFGGGGGGGSTAIGSKERQESQGRGTVLGDLEEQTESLINAADITANASSEIVGVNTQMLNALNRLNGEIESLGSSLFKLGANSGFSFGETQFGSFEGGFSSFLAAVFSRRVDSGVSIGSGSLLGALSNPQVQAYATFNRGGQQFEELPTEITSGVSEIFTGIRTAIFDSARELEGQTSSVFFRAALGAFDGLLISLEGLSGDEFEQALQSGFSQFADNAVAIALPFIRDFQLLGEGLFETLARVTANSQVTRIALSRVDQEINANTVRRTITLSNALIESAGGLGDFADLVSDFIDSFFTDGQKLGVAFDDLGRGFAAVNTAVPQSRDEFAELVRSIDINSVSAAEYYNNLLALAPVVDEYFNQLNDIRDDAESFNSALGLNDGLNPLRRALDEYGFTLSQVQTAADGGIESLQMLFASLDDVGRAGLEPFVDDILALSPAIDDVTNSVDSLANASANIRDFLAQQEQQTFSGSLSQFNAAVIGATADADLANSLPQLAGAVLTNAQSVAGSAIELRRIEAAVRNDLRAVADAIDTQQPLDEANLTLTRIESLIQGNQQILEGILSGTTGVTSAQISSNAPPSTQNNDARMQSIEAKQSENNEMMRQALYAVAKNTGNTAKYLERWDGDGLPETRDVTA